MLFEEVSRISGRCEEDIEISFFTDFVDKDDLVIPTERIYEMLFSIFEHSFHSTINPQKGGERIYFFLYLYPLVLSFIYIVFIWNSRI